MIWSKYLLGCWSPWLRSDPSKVNLFSCRRLDSKAYFWLMSVLTTLITRVKIKTMIFHMDNSLTVLPYANFWLWMWRSGIWNKWIQIFLNKSNTLKLDWLWIIWNMKWNILFISNTNFLLLLLKISSQGVMMVLGSAG